MVLSYLLLEVSALPELEEVDDPTSQFTPTPSTRKQIKLYKLNKM